MFCIKIPATSANLGPGFDSIGIALKLYNNFIFKEVSQGFSITIEDENGNNVKLPLKKNLLYLAIKRLYKVCGKRMDGIAIKEKISIPLARGLGSSATAIMAGLTGGNILLGNPLKENELLKMALEIEGHPDNIVPALKGGFVINVPGNEELIYQRTEVYEKLKIVLAVPSLHLETAKLREVLPESIPFKDAVFNQSRTALLTAAFCENNWNHLAVAMEDRLHQDYRADLIPGLKEVISQAYRKGALGAALSGAGPTVVAFTRSRTEEIGKVMIKTFQKFGVNSRYIITTADNRGLQLIEKGE